jgi:hypothetical protein
MPGALPRGPGIFFNYYNAVFNIGDYTDKGPMVKDLEMQ